MQPNHDAAYFAVIVCLPLLVRLLMVPRIGEPVRAASLRLGERLWAHLVERDEPDDRALEHWALVRLGELERHLARVTSLITDDEDMSATRQLGNRLAHARLSVDVAEALAGAPERVEQPPNVTWQPLTTVRYLPAPAVASASRVETLEF